jgi:hypothetical protein
MVASLNDWESIREAITAEIGMHFRGDAFVDVDFRADVTRRLGRITDGPSFFRSYDSALSASLPKPRTPPPSRRSNNRCIAR